MQTLNRIQTLINVFFVCAQERQDVYTVAGFSLKIIHFCNDGCYNIRPYLKVLLIYS